MPCSEYDRLLGKGNKVEYDTLLKLISDGLTAKAKQIWQKKVAARKRKLIVLYGGALHNDLEPLEELRGYTYAPALQRLSKGRYVELDLYVPEWVQDDPVMKNHKWYPLLSHTTTKQVILVKKGEASFLLLMRRGIQ